MNGFDVVELEQPGFLGRVFHQKPKGNAFREIQNLLARRSIHDLSAADVENVLSEYELPREDAVDGLRNLYRAAVAFYIADLKLSDEDVADLRQLRYVLGLEDDDAKHIETELFAEKYRSELRKALQGRQLSDQQKTSLDAMAVNFAMADSLKTSIYKEEALAVVQAAFKEALADRRLTADEEKSLAMMSENLGVKITHDVESQRFINRCRLLAQIESGHLPVIQTRILLQRGETCHAQFAATLHELRTVTRAVAYHGPTGRVRIMKGLSWRYGYVNLNRVTSEQLRELDAGTLFITNKRLLFNGAKKNLTLPLKRMIHFTLYKDGLQIERDSGRDQVFKGEGDIELLGAILDAVLHASRAAA